MHKPRLLIILPMLALASLGAGCGKAPASSPAASSIPPTAGGPALFPSTPSAPADARTALRAAMKNFADVKSFRTKVTIQSSQGKMDATLEFAKPNRFRGTVDLPNGGTTQIIVVDDSLFMRVNGQSWLNLSKTPSAKTIGGTLRNALQGDASLSGLGTDELADIRTSHDANRGCDDYKTTVTSADGSAVDVDLCVADGLPKFLDMSPKSGSIHLEYYDYNAVFSIEKPTL